MSILQHSAPAVESFADDLLAVAFANDSDRLLPDPARIDRELRAAFAADYDRLLAGTDPVDALLSRLREEGKARVARLCPPKVWTIEDGPAEVDVEPVSSLDSAWYTGLALGVAGLGWAQAPSDMDADHARAFEMGLDAGLSDFYGDAPDFDDEPAYAEHHGCWGGSID